MGQYERGRTICPRCHATLVPQTRVGVVVGVCERCARLCLDRLEILTLATELQTVQQEVRAAMSAVPSDRGPLLRLRRRLVTWERLLAVFGVPANAGEHHSTHTPVRTYGRHAAITVKGDVARNQRGRCSKCSISRKY